MPSKQEYALSLENWRNGIDSSDLAAFANEANKAPFAERITTLPVRPNEFAKLIKPNDYSAENIATQRIYEWAEKTEPNIKIWASSPISTGDILEAMRQYIDFNPQSSCIWISPPFAGKYPESRINWYQVIEVNGEIYLFRRHLPSPHSAKECLQMAKKLLSYSQSIPLAEISDPEMLRATPLPITIPGRNPIDFLREVIDIPGVWKTISLGEDIDRNKLTFEVAEEIKNEFAHRVAAAHTLCQQRLIGAEIEIYLQSRLGIVLMADGHGPLYSQTLNLLTSQPGFEFLSSLLSREGTREHCGDCPDKKGKKFAFGEKCQKK
jgi:hypothetical protein